VTSGYAEFEHTVHESISLEGRATDSETGEPLAAVVIENLRFGTSDDEPFELFSAIDPS
jgi:hypothetical protein